jgi:hypothetical protein
MEAMKEIKNLEEEKMMIIMNERDRRTVSYKEGEKPLDTGYSYVKTREEIARIDGRIREIKAALALANATVRIEEFDVTVGEALVMLAQYTAEYDRLGDMANMQQLTRRITPNGTLEYTKCLFDVKGADSDRRELKRKISALQIAIDRANLTSMIEI